MNATESTATIWSIAGSDSSGGAGIQADIKTATSLGVHAATVITALTAQNSLGVNHVAVTPIDSFVAQLKALLTDIRPSAIKIGLLASIEQVNAVVALLLECERRYGRRPFVVFDPVLVSSSGDVMANTGVSDAIIQRLLPVVDALTPNVMELSRLSGFECDDVDSMRHAAQSLLVMGCKVIVVTGGHANDADCIDRIYSKALRFSMTSPRLTAANNHGTGCIFSSAIASAISHDYLLEDALVIAKAYINQGLKSSYPIGEGAGPLGHKGWPENIADFPSVGAIDPKCETEQNTAQSFSRTGFASCHASSLGLYPVVPSVDWIERLLKLGVKTIQLRIKDSKEDQVEAEIIRAIGLGKQYQARVFINDYWRLAIKHQAYGVHLGQEDVQLADLEKIRAAGLRLGLSTHGYYELQRAKALKPSYIALGHIFATKTKNMPSNPQGLVNLARYQSLCPAIPTVAIGGISVDRVPAVKQTGVGSIAMVTAITEAEDWQQTTRELIDRIGVGDAVEVDDVECIE